jgi:hypothetical protein
MYSDKFVVAIKANGKILKETKDLVHLPFGSEFSVLVKNLNSRRAKFTLHIDGQDVLDGENIVVNSNSEVEMKRFIKNGNMDSGNAFKFIERTAAIENGPRGIKMDDGVVRVEFWFEQQEAVITTTHHNHVWWDSYHYPYRRDYWGGPYYGTLNSISGNSGSLQNASLGSMTKSVKTAMNSSKIGGASASGSTETFSATTASDTAAAYNMSTATMDSYSPPVEENETGITVPGSKVDQKFHTVYGFKAENVSNVIVIRMAGRAGSVEVSTPVIARTKQKCVTCGHVNKANAKFCSECGTGLEIV